MVGELQPHTSPWPIASSSATRPPESRSAPGTSSSVAAGDALRDHATAATRARALNEAPNQKAACSPRCSRDQAADRIADADAGGGRHRQQRDHRRGSSGWAGHHARRPSPAAPGRARRPASRGPARERSATPESAAIAPPSVTTAEAADEHQAAVRAVAEAAEDRCADRPGQQGNGQRPLARRSATRGSRWRSAG